VEKRFARDECFGQNRSPSRQVSMTVSELVETLHKEEGGDLYYLSTQQQQEQNKDDDQGVAPSSFQVPCRQLLQSNILDETLEWAGKLVLESCNLWMGCTPRPPILLHLEKEDGPSPSSTATTIDNITGSCSGLHHDFHDNFYLLLQGKKEIRLYSPDAAPYMQLRGQVECIHFNGVISYVGRETRADGVPLTLVDNHKNNQNGHAGKASRQQGNKDNSDNDDDDFDEEELVLGKGFDYVSSSDEDDTKHVLLNAQDAVDDYDDTCSPGGNVADGSPQDSAAFNTDEQAVKNKTDKDNNSGQYTDEEDEEEEEELVLGKGFDYVSSDEEDVNNVKLSSVLDTDDVVDDYEEMFPLQDGENGDSLAHSPEGQDPPGDNFSRIGNPAASTTSARFPEFWHNCQTCVVELQAGQSLYIPAGWFHSVTSFGGASVDDTETDYKNDIHMALNYWYHPPDVLDCFDKPYVHEEDIRAAGR
jgi:hypothetical protein